MLRNSTIKLSILLWTLLLFLSARSQGFDYGNGWINPAQNYARLLVVEDGIYRVSASDLQSAAVNTNGMNPDNIHLIYRGQEQYIHVEKNGNQLDFVEFLGRRSDGTADSAMYRQPYSGLQDGTLSPNLLINNFSDTAVYYFYFDTIPGLRLTNNYQMNYGAYSPEPSYLHTAYEEFHPNNGAQFLAIGGQQYDIFTTLNSQWTSGEGYVGPLLSFNNPLNITFDTPFSSGTGLSQVNYRVKGHSSWQHILEAKVNANTLQADTLNGLYIKTHSAIYAGIISPNTTLQLNAFGPQNGNTDNNYLCWASFTYNRQTNLGNNGSTIFPYSSPTPSYYRFVNSDINTEAIAYDLLNHVRNMGTASGDTLNIILASSTNSTGIYLSTDKDYKSPVILPDDGISQLSQSPGADFVIITDRSLSTSALAYKSYRDTCTVNPLFAKVIYMDELYNEFSYGTASPLAIKRFCKYAIENWQTSPGYFLLWGKASNEIRNSPNNLVPTYGYPASDHLFLSDFDADSSDLVPLAAIGRVTCKSNSEGFSYLDKLDEYEHTSPAEWMRNGIFLGGGNDTLEQAPIHNFLANKFATEFTSAPEYGRNLLYWKHDTTDMANTPISVDSAVNAGAKLITWFAHSSVNIFDVDLGEHTNYTNWGRYPFIVGLGSYSGNFLESPSTLSERWVLAEDRGAIGFLTNSTAGYLTPLGNYTKEWFKTAFTTNHGQRMGDLVLETIQKTLLQFSDQVYRNQVMQMSLQGDPAIRLYDSDFAVWPGDGNDDLIVNMSDLLSVGLAFADTGATRPNASNTWIAQDAFPWQGAFSNGVNLAHADANGDGIVNSADTLAISMNYGLSHNKYGGRSNKKDGLPALRVVPEADSLTAGSHSSLYIHLGDSAEQAQNVHGLAFSIFYDLDLVDPDSIIVDFDSCWLGQMGQNLLTMFKHFPAQGKIDIGITRTDGQTISGSGVITRLGIVVIDNISGKRFDEDIFAPLAISVREAHAVDNAGNPVYFSEKETIVTVHKHLESPSLAEGELFSIFPNPVVDAFEILSVYEGQMEAVLFQVDGKEVLRHKFLEGEQRILNMQGLAEGLYLLQLRSENESQVLKVKKTNR